MRIKIIFVTILIRSCLLAQTNVDSVLNYIDKINVDSLRFKALVYLSELYSDGSPEKAITYLEQAKKIAILLKNNAFIANVTNDLGNNNYYIGNFDKAIKNYLESMLANEVLQNSRGVANMMNNIASVYVEQGNYKKALEYNFNALKIREENFEKNIGSKDEVAMSLGNIGRAYYYLNDFNNAMKYYDKSLNLSQETGNKKREALMYNNIGSVYAEKGVFDKALDYFNKTFTIQYELGNKQMQSLVLNNIAEVYYKKKEYKYAIDFYNKALNIAKELGSKDDVKTSYDGLHSCYSDLKDFELAHHYLQLYMEVKDSLFNEENSAQLNEMLTKFESDKKQQQIELLQKDKEVHAALRNSLIVGCLMILVVALLLYNRNKVKQKANIDLAEKNKNIEEKNQLIELKNLELSFKNKDITDSIKYAKRLQLAILPPDNQVKRLLPNSFVLYKPKDIVSGDFYWVEQWGNKVLVAVADCTGHGVPGAFMSIVGNNLLQQAVNIYGLSKPSLILNDLNKNISKILHQSEETSSVKDGMDIALISIDFENAKLEYSGAYNPLWIIRDNSIVEIVADKHPIGAFVDEELKLFKNNEVDLKKGDTIYIFTDGYADQFGGEKGKKFKYKSLKDLLLISQYKTMDEHKVILELEFNRWKGNLEQIDDVCIIGVRI